MKSENKSRSKNCEGVFFVFQSNDAGMIETCNVKTTCKIDEMLRKSCKIYGFVKWLIDNEHEVSGKLVRGFAPTLSLTVFI